MNNFGIPMASAAQINSNIPSEGDTRLPLSVTPFQPIDAIKNTTDVYKMADAMQNFQENKQDREQKMLDKSVLQSYLQNGGDLYTPEGLDRASKDLKGKVSLDAFSNLEKTSDAKKLSQIKLKKSLSDLSVSDLQLVSAQQEELSKLMSGPLQAYDQTLMETKNPQQAQQAFQAAKQAAIEMASKMAGAEDKPIFTPEKLEQFAKIGPDQLKGMIATSNWHRKIVSEEIQNNLHKAQAESTQALATSRIQGKELTSIKAIDDALASGEITEEEAKAARSKATNLGGAKSDYQSTLTPEAIDFIAKRVANGDKTALQNIGRGSQGAANLTAINNKVATLGLGERDIQNAQQSIAAAGAGLRSAAQRSAKIDSAAIELDKFSDNALASLSKVSRGNIVPLNKIMSNVAKGAGSPEEVEFATYVQSLVGAYASVIGRGSSTVHSQEVADKIISKDYSPEQFKAMVAALKKEAKAVQDSSKGASENIRNETFSGGSKVSSSDQSAKDKEAGKIRLQEVGGDIERAKQEVKKIDDQIKTAKGDAASILQGERKLWQSAIDSAQTNSSPSSKVEKKVVSWKDLQ